MFGFEERWGQVGGVREREAEKAGQQQRRAVGHAFGVTEGVTRGGETICAALLLR